MKSKKVGLFGKHLRIMRVMNEQSLQDMAKDIGVSYTYISLVENGKRLVPFDWVDRIAEVYDLTESEKKKLSDLAIKQNKEYYKKQLEEMYSEQKKESVYKYRDCNKSKKVRGKK